MIATNKCHTSKNTDLTEITIRPMTDEDITPYCNLFQSVFSGEPWNEKWSISQIEATITRHIRKKTFVGFVVTNRHSNIGYLTGFRFWLFPSIFYLDQLFVNADYQGLKIGKRLLVETEQHLKNQGVSSIFLLTKRQTYAEKFYITNSYMSFLRAIRINKKNIYCKHI